MGPGIPVWANSIFYVNSLSNDKIVDLSEMKVLADGKNYFTYKKEIQYGRSRKFCGKRKKCWLPAFSPLLAMFSMDLFFSR